MRRRLLHPRRSPSADDPAGRPALLRFDPPCRFSPEALEREAIAWAERAGADAVEGCHHADRLDELPGRMLIEESCRLRLADGELELQRHASDLDAELEHAPRREQEAAERHARDAQAVVELSDALRDAPPDRGPRLPLYLAALGLLALAEYPTVASALQTFPAGPTTRTLLAVSLSAVLALAAHSLAGTLRRRIAAAGAHQGSRGEARLQLAVVGFFVVALPTFVLLMAFTRGAGFADIARLTGGVFAHPELTGWLLLALQATLLAIALALGLERAGGAEARRLSRALERANDAEQRTAAARDDATATRALLERRLAALPELAAAWRETETRLAARAIALHDAHFAAAASRPPTAQPVPLRRKAVA